MENEKIQKINVIYLLSYIFAPILLCAICYTIGVMFFPKGNMAVILFMVPSFASFVWWVFGGRIIYNLNKKKFEQELTENGFERDQTFYANGCMVVVDTLNKQLGLLFFWNPFKTFVVPASRVGKAWVDDGKGGVGFMEGSSRVSFLFIIDDIKIRVNTFTSNQRWRMDSEYILTGISKADMMVDIINSAKGEAK